MSSSDTVSDWAANASWGSVLAAETDRVDRPNASFVLLLVGSSVRPCSYCLMYGSATRHPGNSGTWRAFRCGSSVSAPQSRPVNSPGCLMPTCWPSCATRNGAAQARGGDQALIAELDRRGASGPVGDGFDLGGAAGLAQAVPEEAKAGRGGPGLWIARHADRRAVAAVAAGTGRASSAEEVSPEHTKMILTALNALPAIASVEDRRLAEKHLVEAATTLRPREVAARPANPGASASRRGARRRRGAATPSWLRPAAQHRWQLHRHRTAHPGLWRSIAAWLSPRSAPPGRPTTPVPTRAPTVSGCTMRSTSLPAWWSGATNWSTPAPRRRSSSP